MPYSVDNVLMVEPMQNPLVKEFPVNIPIIVSVPVRVSSSPSSSHTSSSSTSPVNRRETLPHSESNTKGGLTLMDLNLPSHISPIHKKRTASFQHRLHDSLELYKAESLEKSHDSSLSDPSSPAHGEDFQNAHHQYDSDEDEDFDDFFEKGQSEEELSNSSEEEDNGFEFDEEADAGFEFDRSDFGEFHNYNDMDVCNRLLQEEEDQEDEEEDEELEDEAYSSDEDGFCFADSDKEDSTPRRLTTPFWFGNEDTEQLRTILESYSKNLQLDEEAKKCRRAPKPFIGRIERERVSNNDVFTTLDTIDIFHRSLLAPGSLMPLQRTVVLLTCWSYDEGLPVKFTTIKENLTKQMWKERTEAKTPASFVTCMPVYGTSSDFNYFVSDENSEIRHSPISGIMASRFWYNQYIPEKFKKLDDYEDGNGKEFPSDSKLTLSA